MRLWGNNRQEWMMAASPPIPKEQSNIQMGSFLRGEEGESFWMLGKNWVWQGGQKEGEVFRDPKLNQFIPFQM